MNLKIPTVDGRTRSGRIPQDVVDADFGKNRWLYPWWKRDEFINQRAKALAKLADFLCLMANTVNVLTDGRNASPSRKASKPF